MSQLTQRKRILDLLRKSDFVPTAQLRLFAFQYNARIKELRDQGWLINSVKQGNRNGFELIGSIEKCQ